MAAVQTELEFKLSQLEEELKKALGKIGKNLNLGFASCFYLVLAFFFFCFVASCVVVFGTDCFTSSFSSVRYYFWPTHFAIFSLALLSRSVSS